MLFEPCCILIIHRKYEAEVADRSAARRAYVQNVPRRLRRAVEYPRELEELPGWEVWLPTAVQQAVHIGEEEVDPDVIDLCTLPTYTATAYRSMYAYGNHFRVRSAEANLTTMDCGVAGKFDQECQAGPRDRNTVRAPVEYVGWVEEILELDYGRVQAIVFLCNWVKAISNGTGPTMKKDEYGFTLINFTRLIPVSAQSFVFPIQVQQVFFSDIIEEPGWKVVLRKEVRARRNAMDLASNMEIELLSNGEDNDFLGLVAPSSAVETPNPTPIINPGLGIPISAAQLVEAERALDDLQAEEASEFDEDYSASEDEPDDQHVPVLEPTMRADLDG